MLFRRISPYSGKENSRDLPVTPEQYDKWRSGTKIQEAMPHLCPEDREFILTGLTQEDWEDIYKEEEKEDD